MKSQTLALFLLLFFACSACGQNQQARQNTPADTLQTDSLQRLSLLFMGDIMGHGPQIRSAYDAQTKTYRYDTVFSHVKDLISQADIAVANLEVTLAGKPYKGYPQFSSPDALAKACKNAGIDILVTANNHSCDRRLSGITRTLDILDTLGIKHTGTFRNLSERESSNLLVMQKNGIKIGILNYTYGTNGIPVPPPAVVNLIDTAQMKKDMLAARKDSLDKLIVFLHFGKEYLSVPERKDIELVKYLFDNQADIVIGAHPHVIRQMEYQAANDSLKSKEEFVAYSLGNFVSNQRKPKTDGGVMAELILEKSPSGTRIVEKNHIFTWVYKKMEYKGKYTYFILPASRFEKDTVFFKNPEDFAKMNRYLKASRLLFKKKNKNVTEKIIPPLVPSKKH